MARFSIKGLDAITASFAQLEKLTDDEVVQLLTPAAEKYKTAYQEAIVQTFNQNTGDLHKSIAIETKTEDGRPFLRVSPKGKHRGTGTGKRMKKTSLGTRRSSGNYSGTNAEVAYYLNFGTPRISATHFLDNAADKIAPEATASTEEAWGDLLASKGL